MNKKYIMAIIFVALILLSGVAISAIDSSPERKIHIQEEEDAFGYFIDANKSKDKSISKFGGKSVEIEYIETINRREQPVEKRTDVYGTYDIFSDSDKNQYYYLYNTDIFCGYRNYEAYAYDLEEADIIINSDDAVKIGNDFIKTYLKPEIEYKYSECEYTESGGVYIVRYNYYIKDVKTDDECILWVRADNGKVSAVSAFNYKRYIKFKDINVSKTQFTENLNTKVKLEYEIINSFITLTDVGELEMFYFVRLASGECIEVLFPIK